MKTSFGSALTRFLWGGVQLSEFECFALTQLVNALPPSLRAIVQAQFESYNLVQREIDGRALNFYRKVWGKVTTDGMPLLPMKSESAPLMRLRLVIPASEVHAVLTAVHGHAFRITFDQDVRQLQRFKTIEVGDVTEAWRSNFSGTA